MFDKSRKLYSIRIYTHFFVAYEKEYIPKRIKCKGPRLSGPLAGSSHFYHGMVCGGHKIRCLFLVGTESMTGTLGETG